MDSSWRNGSTFPDCLWAGVPLGVLRSPSHGARLSLPLFPGSSWSTGVQTCAGCRGQGKSAAPSCGGRCLLKARVRGRISRNLPEALGAFPSVRRRAWQRAEKCPSVAIQVFNQGGHRLSDGRQRQRESSP